ncbi:MAG: zf-HC2 domain-containing protein [Anaerolinea sp.]|nr:zf-HC2 domain-containing protein [Anaerolinea sp.]
MLSSLVEYIDGTLREEVCREIERHLRDCENCRVVVNTLRKTIEIYQVTAEPDTLPADVRQRLFYRLELPNEPTETNSALAHQPGSLCPHCHQARLDYDGTLTLRCPACGYAEGGGCT